MTNLTLRHCDYGPTDHAGGNSLANSSGIARDAMRHVADQAKPGDVIDYDEMEKIDDMEYAALKSLLADRDLALYDSGDGQEVGWKFGKDGSLLNPVYDEVFGPEQPTRSEGDS